MIDFTLKHRDEMVLNEGAEFFSDQMRAVFKAG